LKRCRDGAIGELAAAGDGGEAAQRGIGHQRGLERQFIDDWPRECRYRGSEGAWPALAARGDRGAAADERMAEDVCNEPRVVETRIVPGDLCYAVERCCGRRVDQGRLERRVEAPGCEADWPLTTSVNLLRVAEARVGVIDGELRAIGDEPVLGVSQGSNCARCGGEQFAG
jgi:hypothetical protein